MTCLFRMLFAAALIFGVPSVASAGKLLTGEEIRQTHSGRTFNFVRKIGSKTNRGTISYRADGTATTNVVGVGREAGSWKISGDQLCTVFKGRGEGRICDRVEQVSTSTYRSPRFGFVATRR